MTFNSFEKYGILGLLICILLTVSGCTNSTTTQAPTEVTAQAAVSESTQNQSPSNRGVQETQVSSNLNLKVSYIDVGQADSILIQIPNGKNVLIDAGNNEDANTIVTYLKNQGVSRLDIVIGTHPHEDHIGSLDTVINDFEIGQVVMPKATTTTKTFKDVLLAIQSKGLKITEAKAGLKLDLGSEANGELIAPNSSGYDDLNNYSAALRLVYGKNVFLFMGDAEDVSESEILNAGYPLKADVLKIGHHGSTSSTSASFLKAISPQYAVISVGAGNSYGHPASSTLDRLSSMGIQVYRTDEVGTIVCESDGTTLTFKTIGHSVEPRAPSSSVSSSSSSSSGGTAAVIPVPAGPSSGDSNTTVYVTKTGAKYHIDGCRSLSKSKIPISLSEAKARYAPCSVCNPPR